ncbi:MAG TPA: DUF2505 domain-containing protein [Dermatophilaceae bacterium]|nr:DUF2505 domain-containing protein [Dermatophilaceae bacterium]
MRISATIPYQATPDAVFAMLTDEGFQRRKCERAGALNQVVRITEQDGGALIVTKRTMPTREFPDFVRGMVGETIIVTETANWGAPDADGSRTGTMTVELGGAPVGLSGQLSLRPEGAGSVESVDGDLKARVPLVGGKIESAAAPAIQAAIRVEQEVGTDWLSR